MAIETSGAGYVAFLQVEGGGEETPNESSKPAGGEPASASSAASTPATKKPTWQSRRPKSLLKECVLPCASCVWVPRWERARTQSALHRTRRAAKDGGLEDVIELLDGACLATDRLRDGPWRHGTAGGSR